MFVEGQKKKFQEAEADGVMKKRNALRETPYEGSKTLMLGRVQISVKYHVLAHLTQWDNRSSKSF